MQSNRLEKGSNRGIYILHQNFWLAETFSNSLQLLIKTQQEFKANMKSYIQLETAAIFFFLRTYF